MSIAYTKLALPKPRRKRTVVKRIRTRARVKPMSAKRRKEQRIVAKVFAEIEPRDGACRVARLVARSESLIGRCEGEPHPAHLSQWRRSKTRGWIPEDRHNRTTILRLCASHHRRYDLHVFDIHHDDRGADGPLTVVPYVKRGAAA